MIYRKNNSCERNMLYFMLGAASSSIMLLGCCLCKRSKCTPLSSTENEDLTQDEPSTHKAEVAKKTRSKNLVNQIYKRNHRNNYKYKLRKRSYANWHEKPH